MNVSAAVALAGFTLWLLALPMEGFLLGTAAGGALPRFLLAHVASLVAMALWGRETFPQVSRASGLLAVVGTLVYPYAGGRGGPWVLVSLGLLAAPVLLRAGALLAAAPDPLLAAGLALVTANLLLAGLIPLPLPNTAKIALIALCLCVPSVLPVPAHDRRAHGGRGTLKALAPYLPFLFVFSVVSGLFYGSLMPAYERVRALPAVELLFYVLAVALALKPFSRRKSSVLAAGVVLSVVSLGLFHLQTPLTVNLSMFLMQASAGFMDMFVLFLLLEQQDAVEAFGFGFGALCLGILAGKGVAIASGDLSSTVSLFGSLALNLALLSWTWASRRRSPIAPPVPVPVPATVDPCRLPPGLHGRLSEKERAVLNAVLEGRTFREAAERLRLSLSSVKTYMQRVYEKAEVQNREELLGKLTAARGDLRTGEEPEQGLDRRR